jgi:multisubunit Na+/H+ antiporter MnhB subunit
MNLLLVLDILLITALLTTAWRILESSDIFQAIVLFISFGLFLAMVWLRLAAPDIALAEAAVGAGLTGVLFLGTFKGLEPPSRKFQKPEGLSPCRLDRPEACPTRMHHLAALVGVLGLLVILGSAICDLPRTAGGLAALATESLRPDGVKHPVTAVLLDFRLYDTWLELAVLILALLGVLGAGGRSSIHQPDSPFGENPVLLWLVRLLIPVVLSTAVYILLLGDHAPGGAFQAGVILASGLTLLWLSGYRSVAALPRWLWYALVICGFASIEILAMCTSWLQDVPVLGYPDGLVKSLILVLESLAAFSIGVILATLTVETLTGKDATDSRGSRGRL